MALRKLSCSKAKLTILRIRYFTCKNSALVGVTDSSGASIFSGKEATCFSNAEEEIIQMVKVSNISAFTFVFDGY